MNHHHHNKLLLRGEALIFTILAYTIPPIMKQWLSISFFILLLSFLGVAQTIDSAKVPAAVKAKQKKLYPGAIGILWEHGRYYLSWKYDSNIILYSYRASFRHAKDNIILYIDSLGKKYIANESPKLEVPEPILQEFSQLYPTAKKPEWRNANENDDRHAAFVVSFYDSVKSFTAEFDSAGNFIITTTTYNDSLLIPEPVRNYIKMNFKGYSLTFATEYTYPHPTDETPFIIIDIKKGETMNYYSLTFNRTGKLLRKKKVHYHVIIDF